MHLCENSSSKTSEEKYSVLPSHHLHLPVDGRRDWPNYCNVLITIVTSKILQLSLSLCLSLSLFLSLSLGKLSDGGLTKVSPLLMSYFTPKTMSSGEGRAAGTLPSHGAATQSQGIFTTISSIFSGNKPCLGYVPG